MQLYKLAEMYMEDAAKLRELNLPPEVVMDTLEGMQGDVQDKIRAVICVAREMQGVADKRKEVATDMLDSAKSEANRAAALLSYAQLYIQATGLSLPIKYAEFNVNLQKNPLSCTVKDAAQLAPEFVTTEYTFHVHGSGEKFMLALQKGAAELGIHVPAVTLEAKPDKKAILDALKAIEAVNATKAPGEQRDYLPGAYLNPVAWRLTVK